MSECVKVNWKGESFCWKCRITQFEDENIELREDKRSLAMTLALIVEERTKLREAAQAVVDTARRAKSQQVTYHYLPEIDNLAAALKGVE